MQRRSNTIKHVQSLLAGALVLATAGLAGRLLWPVITQVGAAAQVGSPVRPDEALTGVAAAAALACLGWLALGVVLELLALAPGAAGRAARAVAEVVTPPLLRRLVGVALGVTVVSGWAPGPSVAGPAVSGPGLSPTATAPLPDPGFAPVPDAGLPPTAPQAGTPTTRPPDRSPQARATSAPRESAPDPGWVPTAPTVRTQPDVRTLSTPPRSPDPTTAEVVVRRGDSLWSIVARHLGAGASDAEIAATWPAWYSANRDVIGDDPDVLLPGDVLKAPEVVTP